MDEKEEDTEATILTVLAEIKEIFNPAEMQTTGAETAIKAVVEFGHTLIPHEIKVINKTNG